MTASNPQPAAAECLTVVGLSVDEVRSWLDEKPEPTTQFSADAKKFSEYWIRSRGLLARLPEKRQRSEHQQTAGRVLEEGARAARVEFLRRHGEAVYDALTGSRSRFVRVEELVLRAA